MNLPSIVGQLRRKYLAAAAARNLANRDSLRKGKLRVEELEKREVPATLPAPVISDVTSRAIDNGDVDANDNDLAAQSPVTIVDPTNSSKVVVVYTAPRIPDGNDTRTELLSGKFSADAGVTWTTFAIPNGFIDPTTITDTAAFPYTEVQSHSAGYDGFGNFFVTYVLTNDDQTSGTILFQKFAFTAAAPVRDVAAAKAIYNWVDTDAAYNVNIGIDATRPTITDPTGPVTTNPHGASTAATTRMYIAWNTNDIAPAVTGPFNPNNVRMTASSNGGASWSAQSLVNGSRTDTGYRFSEPVIAITPGRSGGPNGGTIVTAYSANNELRIDRVATTAATLPRVFEATVTNTTINEATNLLNADPHQAVQTNISFTPTGLLNTAGNITASLELSLSYPNISELSIQLISPTNQIVTLVANKTDTFGQAVFGDPGLAGTTIGVVNGANVPTTFDQLAARNIKDTGASEAWTGSFRPEGGNLTTFVQGNAVGNWTLRITDNRNTDVSSTPINERRVHFARLHLSQAFTVAGQGAGDVVLDGDANVVTNASNFEGENYTATNGFAPAGVGVGPSVAIAVDATKGAFSEFQNRIYLAYVGGSTQLIFSDDGGATWSDPSGIGGFLPSLAVDNSTGTVVASFYSTQFDPTGTRAVTMFRSSIDGGDSWSNAVYVNPTEEGFDGIRQEIVDLEPVPSNGPATATAVGAHAGVGNGTSIAVLDGKVQLLYIGNLNRTDDGTQIGSESRQLRTQTINIAAGPRIVAGDQGPIVGASVNDNPAPAGTTYNNVFHSDGRREFNGFVVTFDRWVDPATFTTADVNVRYYAPGATLATPVPNLSPVTLNITPTVITPLDAGAFGATTFLVTIPPQFRVGSYTYSVGPNISDRIRAFTTAPTVAGGNAMDQDMDTIKAEAFNDFDNPGDGYSNVRIDPTTNTVESGALPITITGPRIISTSVPGQPISADNLVKNGIATQLDIVFDRVIPINQFTIADIKRFIGPMGDIPLTGVTVSAISPVAGLATSFRLTFPQQKGAGTYRVIVGSEIADTETNRLDSDADAGLDTFRGSSVIGSPLPASNYTTGPVNIAIAGGSTINIPINVPDAFILTNITANLTLTHPNVRELEARLIGPDGTSVLLFSGAPRNAGASGTNMTNTTFNDNALTNIRDGSGPFANASFSPVTPLSVLNNRGARGNWTLQVRNVGSTVANVTTFQINLGRNDTGTGLGEASADQTSVGFRIFQGDPTSAQGRGNWNPVGPQGVGTANTVGRVSDVAVDPADPTGNTVYAAGSAGGVWRTTNFLTRDAAGPTWVPLTDFGEVNSINVGSIAVFNTSGNVDQTTIIVGTGDANASTRYAPYDATGVGFLLSENGGKTWQILDSRVNANASGTPLAYSDILRDHIFVGATVNKLVLERQGSVSGKPIIYAAVGQGTATDPLAAGLWRSEDGGRNWTRLGNGLPLNADITDVVIGQGSAYPEDGRRPQYFYVSVEGVGVFSSTNSGNSFTQMLGGQGKPIYNSGGVPVTAPTDVPNGNKGKIAIASPAFVANNRLLNTNYQEWLVAAVATPAGDFDGLFVTKDAGRNWTEIVVSSTDVTLLDVSPTKNETTNGAIQADLTNTGGRHSLTVAMDPENPNIVYLGSDALYRIDITAVADPHNMVVYNHSNFDGGTVRRNSTGGAEVATREADPLQGGYPTITGLVFPGFPPNLYSTPTTPAYEGELQSDPHRSWNFLNVLRDPFDPFRADSSIAVSNITRIVNNGFDATWSTVDGGFADYNWISRVITLTDPLSGKTRIVYGDDNGIRTYVANDNGSKNSIPTFETVDDNSVQPGNLQVNARRNGNMQLATMNSGGAQPSLLAADLSSVLFYGAANNNADVGGSPADTLVTGDVTWAGDGRGIPALYTRVDSTGSGRQYILRDIGALQPIPSSPFDPRTPFIRTDFFQVREPNGSPVSKTIGLFQSPNDPQWNSTVRTFAVNPIDKQGLVISSSVGRLFRSVNGGDNWNPIAEPGQLDSTYVQAMSFGAPLPNTVDVNSFIYAGTTGTPTVGNGNAGRIFVSTNSGGTWTEITGAANGGSAATGLDGSSIQKIVPNPSRGSRELYAVTENNVWYMKDWSATGVNGTWVNISGNIRALTLKAFNNNNWQRPVLEGDITSLAVDWRPVFGTTRGNPVLYVGGNGGVFRSLDRGVSWVRYTNTALGAAADGGGMPVVKVTDLELALGNIASATGLPQVNGSPDLLVASTFGRGTWAIPVSNPVGISGPKVASVTPSTPITTQLDNIVVTFDRAMAQDSFTAADITSVVGPAGAIPLAGLNITVTDITVPPPGEPNLHNVFRISFTAQFLDGNYVFNIGPMIQDTGGRLMNQNGNAVNGETTDRYIATVTLGNSDATDFVRQVYSELLNRQPTTAENTARTTAITTAQFVALNAQLTQILLSDGTATVGNPANPTPLNARQRLVDRLFESTGLNEVGNLLPVTYLSLVNRAPLVATAVSQLKLGQRTVETVIRDILLRAEYQTKAAALQTGSANEQFVKQVYADLLNRTPNNTGTGTANELAYWVGRINLAATNKTVFLNTILTGLEYRNRVVTLAFQKYLGRVPTATELTTYRATLAVGPIKGALQGSERLIQKILGSKEYFGRIPNPASAHTNSGWLDQVFIERIGSIPTANQENFYVGKILDGYKTQRLAAINAVLYSTEYRKIRIGEIFNQIHGRIPSGTEEASLLASLARGATFETIMAGRFGTAEFLASSVIVIGSPNLPDNTSFIQAVNQVLLGAQLSGQALTDAQTYVTRFGRTSYATTVLRSTAYRTRLITGQTESWYNDYLNRSANASETTASLTNLSKFRWEYEQAQIMLTREFYDL